MATVVLTLTDAPGGRVTAVAESRHPPIPFLSEDGEVDIEACTPAHAAAVGMAIWLSETSGNCDWRAILRNDDV